MNNIILIGFMGCGKTSIGIRLSYRMHKTLIDTDKMIEKLKNITVSEIFEQDGEEAFRQMETESLQKLLEEADNKIISAGGGLPLRSENRELLRKLGKVVYLRVTAETVCQRLADDTSRPLLQGEDQYIRVSELLKKRSSVYESAADVIIDVDGKTFEEVMDEIIGNMEEYKDESACN